MTWRSVADRACDPSSTSHSRNLSFFRLCV
jgi:hypothetical protein